MREQNKRTTSSGGVLDVTAAMSETLMVLAYLTCLLDDQTTPKLRSLLIPLVTVHPLHPEKLLSHSLMHFCPARMLSVQAKSISDCCAGLLQQGQVPGLCLGHSASVQKEHHFSDAIESRDTSRWPRPSLHDQARQRPRFQLMASVQTLHLTQLTCKISHGCQPTSPLRRWTFPPATCSSCP